ncbi:MAG: substrate-binding domain-containing protein [Actinomycetota bacterium]
MKRKAFPLLAMLVAASLLIAPALVTGCGGDDAPLVFAAANDLEGSGVLQAWVEDFQDRSGRRMELVVVPDAEAFAMARHGECDVILTHIYEAGLELERLGFLEGGQDVMVGDYVVLGPPGDPAGIRGMESAVDAFAKIAAAGQTFILRFDGSGTADRESTLWSVSEAGTTGNWLLPTDAGTEGALREASQQQAYTLADRSTYYRLADELDLEILVQGGAELTDVYRAAAVSSVTYPDADQEGALEFIDYLLSEDGRSFLDMGAWVPPEEQSETAPREQGEE